MSMVPELDASAQRLNIRMTEGDPINWQWIVEDGASWVGLYECAVKIGEDVFLLDNAVSISTVTDALFAVINDPVAEFLETSSGYPWDIQQIDGPTRFSGLLFVDRQT
jgi:hypothetical protein